ncbi:MAG: acetyltransferase [Desulfuromonas sp. SDB]|nr:MAG: acetyltransferase [Desulfuromonas sp. SDB]
MKYYKKMIGEKCYLSPVNPENYELYTQWLNDPEVTVSLNVAHQVISPEKEKEILQDISRHGYHFAIVESEQNRLLGNCGLHKIDHLNRNATFGIFIGDKSYWNQGYGEEATKLIVDFGFNILNLHNILLKVFSFNTRAIRCYEKVGFREVGRRRQSKIIGGKYYDDVYMDILATEFKFNQIARYLESEEKK